MARSKVPSPSEPEALPTPQPPLASYESWLGIGQQPHPATRPLAIAGETPSPEKPPFLDPNVSKRFFGPYLRLYLLPFWNFFLSDGLERGWLQLRHLKVMLVLLTLMNRENEVRQPQKSIARWAKIPPGNLSKVLKDLEQRGFLLRLGSRKGGFRLMIHPGLATCAHSSQIPRLTSLYEEEIKGSLRLRTPEVGAQGHPRNYVEQERAWWTWHIRDRLLQKKATLVRTQRKAVRTPIQQPLGQSYMEEDWGECCFPA